MIEWKFIGLAVTILLANMTSWTLCKVGLLIEFAEEGNKDKDVSEEVFNWWNKLKMKKLVQTGIFVIELIIIIYMIFDIYREFLLGVM